MCHDRPGGEFLKKGYMTKFFNAVVLAIKYTYNDFAEMEKAICTLKSVCKIDKKDMNELINYQSEKESTVPFVFENGTILNIAYKHIIDGNNSENMIQEVKKHFDKIFNQRLNHYLTYGK
jgi:hypothetical protein